MASSSWEQVQQNDRLLCRKEGGELAGRRPRWKGEREGPGARVGSCGQRRTSLHDARLAPHGAWPSHEILKTSPLEMAVAASEHRRDATLNCPRPSRSLEMSRDRLAGAAEAPPSPALGSRRWPWSTEGSWLGAGAALPGSDPVQRGDPRVPLRDGRLH